LQKKIFTKIIESNPELLPDIEEYIMSILKKVNLSKEKFNNLSLAAAEAASNSIVHGNNCNIEKKVIITIKIDDKEVKVKFKDEGTGFDLVKIPDPTKPENLFKDSGRGIYIMKSFLDDLKFDFTPEGTEVTLIMKI